MMLSLVWAQWPIEMDQPAVIALITAFICWLGAEYISHPKDTAAEKNILMADVEKINSICDLLGKKQFYTLKEVSISDYIPVDSYNDLGSLINYYKDDILPFHNEKIQNLYKKFCENAISFRGKLFLLYTSDGRGFMTWRPRGEGWVLDPEYEKVREKINKLNDEATQLATDWEALLITAKRELKGAPLSIKFI